MKNAPKTAKIRVSEINFLAKYIENSWKFGKFAFLCVGRMPYVPKFILSKHVYFFENFDIFQEFSRPLEYSTAIIIQKIASKSPKLAEMMPNLVDSLSFPYIFYQNAFKCHGILFWSYFEYSEYISKLFWMSGTLFVSAWTQKHRLMNWKRCILMILGTLHMFSA